MLRSATALDEFLTVNRQAVLQRWAREAGRVDPASEDPMPEFLDGLVAALERGDPGEPVRPPAGPIASDGQGTEVGDDLGRTLCRYGVLGEVVLDAAGAAGFDLSPREHRILLRRLIAGMAEAVARRCDEEARHRMAAHIAFVAHELRNPLHVMRMAIALLRRERTGGAGTRIDLLERQLVRLGDLIENLLTIQRLEEGFDLQRQWIDVALLVEEVHAEVAAEAEAKGVRVVADVEAGLVLDGDRRLLRSAITNLLQNGVKFSRADGAVAVYARRDDGVVSVLVEDECGGLPLEHADELFRPYVQGGADRSGFGLGLAIVKRAVEAHGGTVRVDPAAGRGCAFDIRLPVPGGGKLTGPTRDRPGVASQGW